MKSYLNTSALALLCCILAACASNTAINGAQQGITVQLKSSDSTSIPRNDRLTDTSFGNYEFRAQSANAQPFYGVLPLRFRGTRLALDILFFAPATFFNLRSAYPYYEFDVEKQVVRYKRRANDEWKTYTPTTAEAERAEKMFPKK